MIIKVCGMRDRINIGEVAALKPDLMGFIFYRGSKRYVGEDFDPEVVWSLQPEIQTVGVFVNEEINTAVSLARQYRLDFVQLHGTESPGYCREMKEAGFSVLKAFGLYEGIDWSMMGPYTDACDYFLFDTQTKGFGGSGVKFDWSVLDGYRHPKPFLLSGGIGPEDAGSVAAMTHRGFAGIDINSRFESGPAMKDAGKMGDFFETLRKIKV